MTGDVVRYMYISSNTSLPRGVIGGEVGGRKAGKTCYVTEVGTVGTVW